MGIIPAGQHSAAAVAHLLHTDSFVGGRGVSIVHPQEGADFHFLAWLGQGLRNRSISISGQMDLGKAERFISETPMESFLR